MNDQTMQRGHALHVNTPSWSGVAAASAVFCPTKVKVFWDDAAGASEGLGEKGGERERERERELGCGYIC